MKKLFFVTVLFSGLALQTKAQDTTKILNYTIQARTVELMFNVMAQDSQFDDFIEKAKVEFRKAARPTGTTLVTIDTIEVLVAVNMVKLAYRVASFQQAQNWLSTTNTTFRVANSYFNRKLTDFETITSDAVSAARTEGRKRLLGKLQ